MVCIVQKKIHVLFYGSSPNLDDQLSESMIKNKICLAFLSTLSFKKGTTHEDDEAHYSFSHKEHEEHKAHKDFFRFLSARSDSKNTKH